MLYNNEYTVKVFDDGKELASETFNFTQAKITRITTNSPATVETSVGEEATIVYVVEDEAGDPMKGLKVRVRAEDTFTNNIVEEQELTTDEEGKVTFAYTSIDDDSHAIEAVVLDKPTIRNRTVSVDWILAASGLVTVDQAAAITLGDFTWQEYKVTAKTEDGDDFTGRINADFNFAEGAISNIKVETYNPTTEAWDAVTQPNATTGNNQLAIEMVDDHKGEVKFRVRNLAATSTTEVALTPTFWYASPIPATMTALIADETIDDYAPRALGGELVYEDQVAKISISESEDLTLAVGDEAIFTVTVVDQFGNPYRGSDVTVDFFENHDNKATTSSPLTADIDYDQDGTGTGSPSADIVADLTVTAGNTDTGIFDIIIAGTTDGEAGTVYVYVDDENNAKGAYIEFYALEVSSLTLETEEASASTAGYVEYLVSFFDQNGEAMTPDKNIVFQLLDDEGELIDVDVKTDGVIKVELDVDAASPAFTDGAEDKPTGATNDASMVVATTAFSSETQIKVRATQGTEGTYKLRAFIEEGTADATWQLDEFVVEKEFEIVDQEIASAKFTSLGDTDANTTAYKFEKGSYEALIVNSSGNPSIIDLEYTIYDQDDNPLANSEKAIYTVANKTDKDLVVTDSGSATKTVVKGKTEEIAVTLSSATKDVLTINAPDGAAGAVTVTAKVDKFEGTEDTYELVYNVPVEDAAADKFIETAKVVAYNKTSKDILVEYVDEADDKTKQLLLPGTIASKTYHYFNANGTEMSSANIFWTKVVVGLELMIDIDQTAGTLSLHLTN